MPETGLLVNLALALVAATIGGAVAVRLGQSAILGYIVVGALIGPYTTGPVADEATVAALADIGVVFLLFAIGLQLSLRDLLRVGRVAVLGGSLQVVALIGIGFAVATLLGFGPIESLFFGAVISNSSSTVLAKVLAERGEEDAEYGRIAFAWSTVQDLSTIVLVVVLTTLSQGGELGSELFISVGRAVLFLAIALPIGLRVMPWLFEHIALLRNREVFVLSVVTFALATAYLSGFFGLSLALGAFIAGILVGESDVSYQALGELAPLRDVFAGLFFVSVGALLNPAFLVAALPLILIAFLLIVVVKGGISAIIARLFGLGSRTSLLVGAALAQSAEFSFLLARLGVDLGAVGQEMFSLLLSAAALSIALSPWLHTAVPVATRWVDARRGLGPERGEPVPTPRSRFVIICGFGHVGRLIAAALDRRRFAYVVVEDDPRVARGLRERNVTVIQGSAENPRVLERADVAHAAVLIVALPNPLSMRQVVDHARRISPRLPIIARARSAADREFLVQRGVGEMVSAETEVALEMTRYTLARLGVSAAETTAIIAGLRRRAS